MSSVGLRKKNKGKKNRPERSLPLIPPAEHWLCPAMHMHYIFSTALFFTGRFCIQEALKGLDITLGDWATS